MTYDIIGWSSSDKVPGYYAKSNWGVGRVSIGSFPVVCVLTGTKTSDGSMTADSDIEPAYSLADVEALCGARSLMTQQAKAAFTVPGVNVVLAPPAEAGGAVKAYITVVFGGTWSTTGSVVFHINGERIEVNVGSTDTATDAGDTFVEAIGAITNGPTTGVNTTGTVVVTVASAGTSGNQYLLGWDMKLAPAGLTVTVTGGTPKHTKLVPFAGGTGTESVANIINLLEQDVYDVIASAQVDSTNAGRWKVHVESEEAPTIAHLETVMFGSIDTLANASSLSSVTLNSVRAALVWYENCETHPAAIAANAAAYRSSVIGGNPNSVYAGVVLTGVAAQRYASDAPNHNTLNAALNTGVTPLEFKDASVRINRDCVTKCLTNSLPNYNTYGWPHVDVADRMRKEYGALWTARQQVNPYCGPDVAAGEKSAGVGVETPSSLQAAATTLWKEKEKENWIHEVDSHPLSVVWDSNRQCLVAQLPVVVRPQNLQAGAIVSQTVSS